jgi:hypothetical protein
VAFSVVNSSFDGRGQPLVRFNTVLVDTDNSWDKANSAFIAPVDGDYVLSVSSSALITRKIEVLQLIVGTRQFWNAVTFILYQSG